MNTMHNACTRHAPCNAQHMQRASLLHARCITSAMHNACSLARAPARDRAVEAETEREAEHCSCKRPKNRQTTTRPAHAPLQSVRIMRPR